MKNTKRNYIILLMAVFCVVMILFNLDSIGDCLNILVGNASGPEISLNQSRVKVAIGGDTVLTTRLKSKNASNQKVIWSSNNEVVAKVDETGKIEGISVGDTDIVVTTADGQHKASCSVHVYDEKLDFSKNSGFYDKEFSLELSAPRGEIYYTLDGTVPDKTSTKYVEPIKITDSSNNKNTLSMRKDTTAGFLKDEILSAGGDVPVYEIPDYNVDKCTIVRAVVYDEGGQCSDVKTMSYFVGFGDKPGYKNVNVLSLVTEPDNFFGYENGIYVLGKTYDDQKTDGTEHWWWWNGNFRNRGIDWERQVSCQFFDTNKSFVFSQEAGARIQGGGSRGFIQKNLNLYAREEYDGNKRFLGDIFGTDYHPQKMTLSSGSDDYVGKMKDYLIANCASEQQYFSTMDMEPYVLFLNGEYWGMYFLTEKYDDKYVEYHYNVLDDDVVMIKNGLIEEGMEEDIGLWNDTKSFISSQIYIARNGDWPMSNYAMWRTREKGSGSYEDGKWRWMLFDVNSGGLDSYLISFDSVKSTIESDKVFASLMRNEEFKKKLSDAIMEYADTIFKKEKIDKAVEGFISNFEESIMLSNKRFFGNHVTEDGFLERVNDTKTFFDERLPYVKENLLSN